MIFKKLHPLARILGTKCKLSHTSVEKFTDSLKAIEPGSSKRFHLPRNNSKLLLISQGDFLCEIC